VRHFFEEVWRILPRMRLSMVGLTVFLIAWAVECRERHGHSPRFVDPGDIGDAGFFLILPDGGTWRTSVSVCSSPIQQRWLVCRRIDWQAAASDVPVRSGHTTATPRTVTVAG